MARWLWNLSPVLIIGTLLAFQTVALPFVRGAASLTAPLTAVAFVVVMAYLQNWSYTLSSRSSARNSNAYHLFAAALASLTFFVTFRYLALNEMPMVLFPAYLFATVLGSVHGQTISAYIEKRLNLDLITTKAEKALGIEEVKKEKDDPDDQFFRFWPSVVALLALFLAEIAWLRGLEAVTLLAVAAACMLVWQGLQIVQRVVQKDATFGPARIASRLTARLPWKHGYAVAALAAYGLYLLPALALTGVYGYRLHLAQPQTFLLVAVLLLSVPDNFLHSVLRIARSSDHYYFHLAAVLAKLVAGFLQLLILFELDFTWALFLPMTTGGMLGSLTGATFAAEFAKRINAGFDAHVPKSAGEQKKNTGWPVVQTLGLIIGGVAAQLAYFGFFEWRNALLLLALAFAQMMSFTLISRARQRKDKQYHAWASVLSNGTWYFTMDVLAEGKLMPHQAMPYVAGNATGSLIGQGVALKLEQLTGAVMVEKTAKPAATPATA